jgi:hypothetical protein
MARSSTGKSVARAAATGGGTTYRGQMPVNWYAALVLIVILGVGSVALARYHYAQSSPSVQPTVGQTWHAGLAFDVCGTTEPAIPASAASSTSGLTTTGDGVILIAPKSSSEAGNNATLGKFASEYSGLTLTNSTLKAGTGAPEYKNGEKCPTGTPDAGKVGVLRARSWVLSTTTAKNGELTQLGGKTTSKPKNLKLANRQLITVGFLPSNVALPKVTGKIELALLQAIEGTTAPVSTTTTPLTTPPTTPTTSTPTTTTTAPPTTTTSTTAPSTTTTTKPKH